MVESAKLRPKDTYKFGVTGSAELSRRRQAAWDRIPLAQRDASLKAFIEAGQRHNKKNHGTRIETAVADMLINLGCLFARNVRIGIKNVDLLVNDRLVIECYGDYWHCNPQIYDPDYYQANLRMTAAEKWFKDETRNKWLTDQGMIVMVLWEHDIKFNAEAVLCRVADFVGMELKMK